MAIKCEICGNEIGEKDMIEGNPYSVNAAVIGEYRPIAGHKVCCEAVNDLVVLPQRATLQNLITFKRSEHVTKDEEEEEKANTILWQTTKYPGVYLAADAKYYYKVPPDGEGFSTPEEARDALANLKRKT